MRRGEQGREESYILVTRPKKDAVRFAARLDRMGVKALVDPMLVIEPVSFDLPDMRGYRGLVFTSMNAVRVFAEQESGFRDMPVYTVGSRTAEEAYAEGFLDVEAAQGTAIDLLKLLEKNQEEDDVRPLLHLCGDVVSVDMNSGAMPVDSLVVYSSLLVDDFAPETLDLLRGGEIYAVTFFSKRTAQNFMSLIEKHNLLSCLDGTKALCISDSVLKCVQAYAWDSTYVCELPDGESMIRLVHQAMGD